MPSSSAIESFLRQEIAVGSFPGAVYAVGDFNQIISTGAMGNAVVVPLRIAATVDTIYDCASLTKPLITATLLLQAVAEKRLSLDHRHHGYTFRELLTHTSGLRAWLPLYAFADPIATILEQGPEYERGTKVVYSDLNFILLWDALKSLFGDYAAAARSRIFEPLGLEGMALFHPPGSLRPRIAATEWTQRHEIGMCATRGISFNGFRQGLIWGETHDGNSHHRGGTAGNAGLFATAAAVYRVAQAWVTHEFLPASLADEATRNHTAGLEEHRGYGWQLSFPDHPATGMLSPSAFGHTGFTGTSCWIDPQRERIMILLTNRVHPCAAPIAMQKIRGEFHRLALAE